MYLFTANPDREIPFDYASSLLFHAIRPTIEDEDVFEPPFDCGPAPPVSGLWFPGSEWLDVWLYYIYKCLMHFRVIWRKSKKIPDIRP